MSKHIFIYSFFILITLVGFHIDDIYATEDGDGGAGGSMSTVSTSTTLSEAETEAELQRASDAARANDPTWEQAAVNDQAALNNAVNNNSTNSASNGKVVTIVSEKVPGATCVCYINNKAGGADCPVGTKITERKYQCTTESGMSGFQKVFAQIIRFVINIVMLLGVLAVVGLGIAWSFAGGDDMKMKSTLKTWAINLVIGFIILFMFRYILQFLAPWIYK